MGSVSLIVAVLLLLISSAANANALGMPQDKNEAQQNEGENPAQEQESLRDEHPESVNRTAMLGYGMGMASVTVEDPVGDSNTATTFQPVTLIYTDRFLNSFRYWSEFYYYQATMEASLNKVGQDVQRYGARLSMQVHVFGTPGWSAWIGGGLDVSQAVYSARHTVDSGGFLLDVLPNREEVNMAGVVNAFAEWYLKPAWTVGVKLEQSFIGSSHIKESLVAATILYRY
jgi:hypothetical protein